MEDLSRRPCHFEPAPQCHFESAGAPTKPHRRSRADESPRLAASPFTRGDKLKSPLHKGGYRGVTGFSLCDSLPRRLCHTPPSCVLPLRSRCVNITHHVESAEAIRPRSTASLFS